MREDQLWDIQANPKTFQWVWSSSFAEWLSNSDGLFWICGKPASGKSTLIHHMATNKEVGKRLRQTLKINWITVYHFFDFRARIEGESVRNTFEGFLMSLLFQLISATAGNVRHDDIEQDAVSRNTEQHWSRGDLLKRLKRFLGKSPNPICIFVDGLDEYASGQDDIENRQWDLADLLKDISGPRSKLCIASRPEKVFNTAFAQAPSLMMQEWNHEGIREYASQTLQRSLATSGFYKNRELVTLAQEIAARSEGVFLWAHFAINELRNGWARADDLDMSSLRRKLDKIPSELDGIYSRILQSLQPDDRMSVGYMLQLICYARRDLSLDELWVAMERVKSRPKVVLTPWRLKRFEQRVYAITGGILDIFWTVRLTRDESDMRYGFRLHDHAVEDDYGESFRTVRGDPVVTLIHRSVQNFLDSKGWSQILHSTEEIALQSETLWLRLCSEEFSSNATITDSTAASTESIVATVNNMYRAKGGAHGEYVRGIGEAHRLLLPEHDPSILYGSTSFMTESDLEKYLDKRAVSLQQYAALFMLDHASTLERNANISSYPVIRASMTTSYLQLHAYYWSFLGPDNCKHCMFGYSFPTPANPLHLAVTHGLNLYVSDFLTSNEDRPLPETYTKRGRSGFFVRSRYDWNSLDLVDFRSRHRRVDLLEFAVCYAEDTSLISSILTHRKLDVDAALVTALSEDRKLDVIQYLLQNKATSGPIILSPPNLQCFDAFQDQPGDEDDDFDHAAYGDEGSKDIETTTWKYPHLLATRPNVGPLWVVARCYNSRSFHSTEEAIDLFLSRGEDINGICGPFGTALHAAASRPDPPSSFIGMATLLLKRGADINAVGPLGTPLELFWLTLSNKSFERRQEYGLQYSDFINDPPYSDSSLPTAEQMKKFCQLKASSSAPSLSSNQLTGG